MHAYFPALNSFPSLLGDMISDAINCLGFTWASSPAATELEALVMDWMVKCLGLPEKFLNSDQEVLGGGVLQVFTILIQNIKETLGKELWTTRTFRANVDLVDFIDF